MTNGDGPLSHGIALGFGASLIWAGSAVVSRFGVTTTLSPGEIILLRSIGAVAVALAIRAAGIRYPSPVAALGWARTLFIVAIAGPFYHLLLVMGYQQVPASHGLTINVCLMPVFALAIGFWRRKDLPDPATFAGIVCTLGGVGAILIDAGIAAARLNPGYAIFVVTAFLWALYSHAVRDWSIDAFAATMALAFASPVYFLAFPLLEHSAFTQASVADVVLQTAYHGILVAFLATLLFTRSVAILGAPVASVFPAAGPIIAAVLATIFLGEPLTAWKLAGVLLGGIGLLLVGLAWRG